MNKPEAFGVVWIDCLLGPLSLSKPDRETAIKTALEMRQRGGDKIRDCRAVMVAEGSDTLETLA